MNTLPIAQKIQAKYLRAVNNEMIGNYQHSMVVNIMRRIVRLIFETPEFAIDLPIEPRWRDYYTTALEISAYLSYVQYEISADYTIAHITLTPRYRAQILAAAPPPATAPEPPTPPPTTDNAAPAPEPSECSESSESAPTNAAPAPEPSECSEPARVAANSRLNAVTTASLTGSLCISRGQGRRGRPQPSDSSPLPIKPERRNLAPQKPRPIHLIPITLSPHSPSAPSAPSALRQTPPTPPQPDHPPPRALAPR